ncbi:nuclear transport factor 2 family protein [Parasphingorhabdus halotolerans]|uniref:Nuclear transport factor 2 family protein n=1 Tax=Parasphingorhabdus halotolerans TaxID=2725558 RepID=A0A6H2DKX9_9SPHN|nr:nuclear transport factor 2 family protein [Parasphingorhabdus halotolerans]QJB68797.1 nuclear transport factor 2 family protein [Parasphingorhabdus halotolerans]
MSIEQRLQQLEDDRAIRDLKMRYLRASDAKAPEAMRDCFLPEAKILFDGFPPFDTRDPFIEIYKQMGCGAHIFDIHQGGTGVIEFENEARATGWWPLYFHNINLEQRTLTQMGVEYQDVYEKRDGRWRIAESRSYRKSCLIHSVDGDGQATVQVMGEAPESFG